MNKYVMMVAGALAVVLAGCHTSQSQGITSKTAISPEVRQCPDWSSDPVSNYSNEDFSNLGCATSNNLYVQLKDKKDYKHGRSKSGITASRDSAIMQNYMNGAGSGAASSSSDASAASTSR